jgi:hypothetical protein
MGVGKDFLYVPFVYLCTLCQHSLVLNFQIDLIKPQKTSLSMTCAPFRYIDLCESGAIANKQKSVALCPPSSKNSRNDT